MSLSSMKSLREGIFVSSFSFQVLGAFNVGWFALNQSLNLESSKFAKSYEFVNFLKKVAVLYHHVCLQSLLFLLEGFTFFSSNELKNNCQFRRHYHLIPVFIGTPCISCLHVESVIINLNSNIFAQCKKHVI